MNRANKKTRPQKPLPGARVEIGATRPHARHEHSPAGSKPLRRAYKSANGQRGTLDKALAWYASLKGEQA